MPSTEVTQSAAASAVEIWSAVGQVGAAVGAVVAVVVALLIAKRDRDRQEETERRSAEAQASLVLVDFQGRGATIEGRPDKQVCTFEIHNHSDSPIQFIKAEVWAKPHKVTDESNDEESERIILPGASKILGPYMPIYERAERALVAWRVTWTDHHGVTWTVEERNVRPRRFTGGPPIPMDYDNVKRSKRGGAFI